MIDSPKQERPIAVDLFAGAGGMTLGFEQAGFDVLASVEIDPIHCATHEFNFPFWSIFCQSVVDTTGKEIRSRSSIGGREIDVVFGGPPCQGFSVIGKRFFDDPRNSLVLEYIRLVVELQPKFFVMENVKGMTIGKQKEFLTEIINQFEAKGYKVCKDYKILNASEYGIPQNRERLFLLGCRDDLELPEYPAPITKPAKSTLRLPSASPIGEAEASKKSSFPDDLRPTPTVWDALKDLPAIEQYVELYKRDWVTADFGKPSDYGRQLRGFSSIDNNYLYERIYDHRLLTSSLRTEHSLESITRFFSTPHGKTEPISRLYKLDPQGICNTLRAGTPSNKGAFTSPRPIHPFIPRCITVREAARLHSYPDWFRFHATKWHGFRQIGNSVPPLLAKAIASEIIKSLKMKLTKPLTIQNLGNQKLLTFDMSEAAKYYGVNPQVIEPRLRKTKPKESEI
ncbi:DNA cytosine methyltransferase [Aetokthonos hydrillicola Thurmond2011]|jgi:DNA (cytosine-5)-methyltransferase 1|uniref:Cytosine-specific methyltransferase n=1 Tax=Aetokthonos hydrillicola Thurmond2011 TaxID=2712845 RepID=A0AAP5I7Z8_9CYAN|nr:DNA cytosine methyltransferase [Aetokthonos hydrillicola]MBO3460540.1 DNA cytosine methyltransferase [Aetokthonos hydrillicola CCALA 1050]MBW4585332.1 DNA cytosine methyltransferase [Aetokthonos hydrillicola CCALA 1050]MDR9896531.1 DNA cytosine methyltransferase [Aetokthonos hydrillicola Thurmond2011]